MSVPFAHGFNDVFEGYAASSASTLAFQRARDANSSHIRFNVHWTLVQGAGPSSYAWTGGGYNYEELRSQSNSRNLRCLPVIVGCPPNVVARANRAPCAGVYPSDPAYDWTVAWYPSTPTGWNQFAAFCVEALKYFDACQKADTVEIWNEPNLPNGNQMPAWAFSGMLGATISAVNAAAGQFSKPMGVISGGLFMDYTAATWKNYANGFLNQAAPFGFGVHPYDTRDHNGLTQDAAADAVVDRVADLYNQAAQLTSNDLWVTETGASSRQPFNAGGQNRALRKLVGAGQYFQSRARCRGAILHRLYPNDDPGLEGPNTQFHKFSLVLRDQYWTGKEAFGMLSANWA